MSIASRRPALTGAHPRARELPSSLRTRLVASVPASHVYVRHIAPETSDGVVRLADPDPDVPHRSAEQRWWPPVMLDVGWLGSHEYDVFHLQFGFDAYAPMDLAAMVDEVHDRGRLFVQTVHDLRNPHHRTRDLHDAQLDVLIPRADELITLTEGAAEEIERRWGRRACVVPHPHVVELATMEQLAGVPRASSPFRVGLHLKSLRASMEPAVLLPMLVYAVSELPGAVLQVNGHNDVLRPDGVRYDEGLSRYLHEAEARGDLELRVHDFYSDDELWDYLRGLDVSVLPYRFGTHSGWLEACRDLGTAVVAPSCGYYAGQGPVHTFTLDESAWDPQSLRRAVHDAYDAGTVEPLSVSFRRAQREGVAAAHRHVYGMGTVDGA